MDAITFLLDECVPEFLADEIIRLEPAIQVFQVGKESAPRKGTPDPDLLSFAEQNRLTFVTRDKRTMPVHLQKHYEAGRHTYGVFVLVGHHAPARYAEDLVLIWSTMKQDDVIDWFDFLPW